MAKMVDSPRAQAFIKGKKNENDTEPQKKKIISVTIDVALLARIDRAAKSIGVSRAAFFSMSAGKELKEYE